MHGEAEDLLAEDRIPFGGGPGRDSKRMGRKPSGCAVGESLNRGCPHKEELPALRQKRAQNWK